MSLQLLHRIRLQGPWDCCFWSPLEETKTTGESLGELKLPATWWDLFGDRRGLARFSRGFHQPTGLTAADQVHIVLAHVGLPVHLTMNGKEVQLHALTDTQSSRFDGTPHLETFNRLVIELDGSEAIDNSGTPQGLWQPVCLEILGPGNRQQ